jgi:predicted nicotinamide N-methyase
MKRETVQQNSAERQAGGDRPDRHVISRRRLLWRIQRRYQTVTEVRRFGGVEMRFTRVTDPDRVLDEVAAEEDRLEKLRGRVDADELHLPYWAELWDSALGLAQFLVETGPFRGKSRAAGRPREGCSVLDLGCGMGLAGAVAARLGAHVLFADLEPDALLFARLNSMQAQSHGTQVRTRRLNWRTDRLEEQFDLILGADILYERAQWIHLEPFWRQHLAPGGRVLLGEPGRQTGELFVSWIAEKGWTLQERTQRVPTRETPVRIFELGRDSCT